MKSDDREKNVCTPRTFRTDLLFQEMHGGDEDLAVRLFMIVFKNHSSHARYDMYEQ